MNFFFNDTFEKYSALWNLQSFRAVPPFLISPSFLLQETINHKAAVISNQLYGNIKQASDCISTHSPRTV